MLKALYQGKDWKEGNKKVVAHRQHNVHTDRRKRMKMDSMPYRGRNSKNWNKWKKSLSKEEMIEQRIRERDKKNMTPAQFRDKYPRQSDFKTDAFALAFAAAGIHVSHEN